MPDGQTTTLDNPFREEIHYYLGNYVGSSVNDFSNQLFFLTARKEITFSHKIERRVNFILTKPFHALLTLLLKSPLSNNIA